MNAAVLVPGCVFPPSLNSPLLLSYSPRWCSFVSLLYRPPHQRNKYIDYVGTWGPAIVGHADDEVLDAIKVTRQNLFLSRAFVSKHQHKSLFSWRPCRRQQ